MTLFDPSLGSPEARTLHTDGSCSYMTRIGGWAWVNLADDHHACGCARDTTSQRMEIKAAFEAVKNNDGPLVIISDSRYVVDCFLQRWFVSWHANEWKNSRKRQVANRDLWEPFIQLVLTRGDVQFDWVKGHTGDPGNERADSLAGWAAAQA